MNKVLRLIIILCCLPHISKGQYELFEDDDFETQKINIDSSAKRKFTETKSILDTSLIKFLNRLESSSNESFGCDVSYVIFKPLKCDTINLLDLEIPDYSGIKILSMNGELLEEDSEYRELHKHENILFGPTYKIGSKMQTLFGMIFGEYSMKISYSDGNFKFDFEEYYKEDEILSLKGDEYTNELSWPLDSFSLNLGKVISKEEKEIFGYGSFKSDKFYKKGQYHNNQVLELVCYSDFYLKLKITD